MMQRIAGESRSERSAAGVWSVRLGALGALLALGVTDARAQSREDGAPAEVLGVADAVRASVWGPAALHVNPAGLLRVPAVLFEARYAYLEGKDGHAFGVSGIDAKTSELVALGVAYDYITGTPGGRDRDGHQFRAALGTGYKSGDVHLYAGFGGRYLGLTLGADDDESDERDDVDRWTVDAGLIFDFARIIKIGVVGQNLIDTKTIEAARGLGLGLSFVFDTLEIGADMDIDLSDRFEDNIKSYAFGVDYGFAETFRIRAGFLVDQVRDEERVTAGLGYSTSALAIDVGYSTALADPTDMVIAVSLRFLPSIP
ncbi:MAG: hypothetical protein IT385_30920 [Deltaproteobacteria bacterium]|nr:hypothetical protein [Deltaproteobacteria bacterium]